MDIRTYRAWLTVARRFSRVASEAEDLLQDALLIAAREDRLEFSSEDNRRWFTGVLKNQAKMAARSASRRRKREQQVASEARDERPRTPGPMGTDVFTWLDELPPSARRVVVLGLHGLGANEIQSVLGLSSTAFRQRLTTARKALGKLPDDLQRESLACAYARRTERADEFTFGLLRRALLRRLHLTSAPQKPELRESTELRAGAHDPDGHLIILAERRRHRGPS